MSEFSEMIGMETGNAFKSGYNCCEAIVQAFRTTATDYEYFLHIYVCYIYNVSLVFKLLVYTMQRENCLHINA